MPSGIHLSFDWVIIDRLLEIAAGCVEAAQQDMGRLLASAAEDGDQAAANVWRCHFAAFRAEIEQFSS